MTTVTAHSFLDRADMRLDPLADPLHATFIQRCGLFKKAKSQEYLASIWGLEGLDERSGRVAIVHDIIKGVIRIGKVA